MWWKSGSHSPHYKSGVTSLQLLWPFLQDYSKCFPTPTIRVEYPCIERSHTLAIALKLVGLPHKSVGLSTVDTFWQHAPQTPKTNYFALILWIHLCSFLSSALMFKQHASSVKLRPLFISTCPVHVLFVHPLCSSSALHASSCLPFFEWYSNFLLSNSLLRPRHETILYFHMHFCKMGPCVPTPYWCFGNLEVDRLTCRSTTFRKSRSWYARALLRKFKDLRGLQKMPGPSRALKMSFSNSGVFKDFKDLCTPCSGKAVAI